MPWPVHVLLFACTGGIWFFVWVGIRLFKGRKSKGDQPAVVIVNNAPK